MKAQDGKPVSQPAEKPERFKMPTDDQILITVVLFNGGRLDYEELPNMVGMCQFVIDRLYENGDMLIPSSKEVK